MRHERAHADRDERNRGLDGLVGLSAHREANTLVSGLRLLDFGAGEDFDPLFDQGFFEGNADFRILDRKDVREHFDDRDIRAEGIEKIGELHSDGAGPDDDDVLRLLGKDHGLLAADDAFAVERKSGHFPRDHAGGNQDLCALDFRLLAVLVRDFNDPGFRHGGLSADIVDLVFLKEHFDAPRQLVGDFAAAANDFVPLVAESLDFDAEVGGVVAEELIDLGVLQERFCRDASPVQAGSPGAVHLDARHFFSQLGRANRPHVSGRSAAHNNQIVISHNI